MGALYRFLSILLALGLFAPTWAKDNNDPKETFIDALTLWVDGKTDKAVKKMEEASNLGFNEAGYYLWQCYNEGVGVKANPALAMEHLQKSANGGFSDAQLVLGLAYFSGNGVETNYPEGFKWMLAAAQQNDQDAITAVIECYENGFGVEANADEASMWREKLEKTKNPDNATDAERIEPKFPGGEQALFQWLGDHMRWPKGANITSDSGKVGVKVQFTIDESGEPCRVKILRNSGSYLFGLEAKRVVMKMPKWIPGEINGKKTKCTYVLPLTFKKQ